MSVYDDAQEVAKEVLEEFNQGVIQLVSVTAATGGTADDPGDPTEATNDLDAVVAGVSYQFVQQGLAVVSDKLVIAAVLDGVTIGPVDYIIVDGVRYKIVADVSTPGAGTRAVWKFIIRKRGVNDRSAHP